MSAIILPKKENFLTADEAAGVTNGIKRTCSGTGLVDLAATLKASSSATANANERASYKNVKELYEKFAVRVPNCEWISRYEGKVWNGEKEMKMEIDSLDEDMWRVELVTAYDNLFCLHIKTSLEDGVVYILAQHIVNGEETRSPQFMIRTEFCTPDNLECICNSTKIHPYTENIEEIKERKLCAVRPIEVLRRFAHDDGVLRFSAKINPVAYF